MLRRIASSSHRRPLKDATRLWRSYSQLRQEADRERRRSAHSPEVLDLIRTDVARWLEDDQLALVSAWSGDTNREWAQAKLLGLVGLLRNYPEFVTEVELAATEQFVELAFALYGADGGPLVGPSEQSATYAFMVQMRLSAENLEYLDEAVPAVPAMYYVPGSLREVMMMGLPPFVADTYRVNDATGYLIVAPVYAGLATRMTRNEFVRSSRIYIQDSVNFARRLNTVCIGLGGMLPSLTRYGRAIQAPGALVTTGHAGTISLVVANVERAIEQQRIGSGSAIGVLGLGSIGQSIAKEIVHRYQSQYTVVVYDKKTNACKQFMKSLPVAAQSSAAVAQSAGELIDRCGIVVSAVAGRIDIDAELDTAACPLTGKVFIDDSQPFSLIPDRISELGGTITWVVARTGSNIRRGWYDYGTMGDRNHDFFGCEAEVAVLQAEYCEHLAAGASPDAALGLARRNSISHAATRSDVAAIGRLFRKHGVGISDLQTFAAPDLSDLIIDLRDREPALLDLDSPSPVDIGLKMHDKGLE